MNFQQIINNIESNNSLNIEYELNNLIYQYGGMTLNAQFPTKVLYLLALMERKKVQDTFYNEPTR